MAVGPIGVSSSSASSAISSQSLNFNPVITLASPEAQIRNQPSSTQSNDARATTEAKAETKMPGLFGGGDGGTADGVGGFLPSLSLGGSRGMGGGPNFLAGDLVPGSGAAGGMGGGLMSWLLIGAAGLAAYFLVRRFA